MVTGESSDVNRLISITISQIISLGHIDAKEKQIVLDFGLNCFSMLLDYIYLLNSNYKQLK